MFKPESSVLLIIDVQGKLAYLMHEKEKFFRNLASTIKVAHLLNIPILWTEQVPQKIGATVAEVAGLLNGLAPITKTSFSCLQEPAFAKALKKLKHRQIIVVGIETHVCVYQTVADLLDQKYSVQVVVDAVSSRSEATKSHGLKRMEQEGALLTCAEMIACELLGKAEGPKFKEILQLIK